MDTNTTRRGVLGAMAAAPLLTLPAIPALANRDNWTAAKACYHQAWAELDAHPFNTAVPGDPDYARMDADNKLHVRRAVQSVDDLMAVPAPDSAAAIEKLEIYLKEYGDESGEGHIGRIIADLRRLAAH